jgi:hypothetical protein
MVISQGTRPPPATPGEERAPIRLRLSQASRYGPIDGAWWPYGRDASDEIRALVAELDTRLPREVIRVDVQRSGWDDIPRELSVGARQIQVGWFRSGDPNLVTMVTRDRVTTQLMVIPPHTPEAAASAAMAIAASGTNTAQPDAILGSGRSTVGDDQAEAAAEAEAEAVWLGEGGKQ